jgi:hypothetical protein
MIARYRAHGTYLLLHRVLLFVSHSNLFTCSPLGFMDKLIQLLVSILLFIAFIVRSAVSRSDTRCLSARAGGQAGATYLSGRRKRNAGDAPGLLVGAKTRRLLGPHRGHRWSRTQIEFRRLQSPAESAAFDPKPSEMIADSGSQLTQYSSAASEGARLTICKISALTRSLRCSEWISCSIPSGDCLDVWHRSLQR